MAATATYESKSLDQSPFVARAGPSAPRILVSPARLAPQAANMATATTATSTATTAPEGRQSSKASSSPSKKKLQVKKNRLPEVGPTIQDLENGVVHITGKLLGQGGFARVYQVQAPDGKAMAFKAIMKEALLHQRKNRQKVLAEILIHRSLDHPNIVRFHDLFQDHANIYFKLELCANGSMNDMVRTRGRCLDEEARFYMVQILAGTKHMHNNHVIHRDLKLGNIFLDANMNIKIGDFGLAALLRDPEERKKTMCGTPNYIAPEILYEGNGQGHSFEVDVWSVGVILFTLLSGKPPFQTSSVPAIYEKIRKNEYTIPEYVHPEAADLITRILTPDPSQRPSLVEIMNHPWFTAGLMPLHVPSTATKATPHLSLPRTMQESLRNLQTVKDLAGWRDDADDEAEEDEENDENVRQSAREKRRAAERAEEEREKMDFEFERAIQPGSSLAGFLKLGRKALPKAPESHGPLRPKAVTGLSRQLCALSVSRQQGSVQSLAPAAKIVEKTPSPAATFVDKENDAYAASNGRMMPPPLLASHRLRNETNVAEDRMALGHKARLVANMAVSGSAGSLASSHRPDSRASGSDEETAVADLQARRENLNLDTTVQNLTAALDACQNRTSFVPHDRLGNKIYVPQTNQPDTHNFVRMRPLGPSAYVICWLDEMDKYGLGYALSDGTVGSYLKDESSVATNAQRTHFEHVTRCNPGRPSSPAPRLENYPVAELTSGQSIVTRDTLRKFKVLSYFEEKIMDRLAGVGFPCRDEERTMEMPHVSRWYRCLQAIVFRLSTSTLQFNFYDHTKLYFSHNGLVISAIVPDRTTGEPTPMRSWTLSEFVDIVERNRSPREQAGLANPPLEEGMDPYMSEEENPRLPLTTSEERKLVRSLLVKVRYARDTMMKILSKDAAAAASAASSTNPSPVHGATSAAHALTSRPLSRAASQQSLSSTASSRRI